jgi:hypothetical protein
MQKNTPQTLPLISITSQLPLSRGDRLLPVIFSIPLVGLCERPARCETNKPDFERLPAEIVMLSLSKHDPFAKPVLIFG